MTVAELLDRMSSREFSEWMAYYGIEPFGEERADHVVSVMLSSFIHRSTARTPFVLYFLCLATAATI